MKILKLNKHKGISLPISLFVLMGVLLAATALIRSNEFAISVAGNISYRETVSSANENAVLTANDWLLANSGNLQNDDAANGYYSSFPSTPIDYTNPTNWGSAKSLPKDSYGNTSSYIIHRMCTQPNTSYNGMNGSNPNICGLRPATDAGSTANSGNSSGFGSFQFISQPLLYYTVIVKTVGPKSASTITETMIGMPAS